MKKILVVDDEKQICTFFSHLLKRKGYEVTSVQSGCEALEIIEKNNFHLALLDLKLPDSDGLTLLKKIKEKNWSCQVIIMTGYSTVKSAITAMQNGALDYIEKPFDDLEVLEKLIDNALNTRPVVANEGLQEIALESGIVLGKNQKMYEVVDLARRVAGKHVTVLIQGETGTGKEVFARFIHNCSKRAGNPFIPINCAAISETLLESELFGYEKGAFTGAIKNRKGFFEIASSGTLFLDEISEATLSIQAKLLRVLETGEYMRVGGESVLRTDSRIVAASNVMLNDAVEKRTFRQDLFYRLDVLTLRIPPLRERPEDIPYLLEYYLKRYTKGKDVEVREFSDSALAVLCNYNWPGNVRELVNLVQWLVTVVDEPRIKPYHLPEKIFTQKDILPVINQPVANSDSVETEGMLEKGADLLVERMEKLLEKGQRLDLTSILEDIAELKNHVAKSLVKKALATTLGERKEAAELLGITPRSLKYLYQGK